MRARQLTAGLGGFLALAVILAGCAHPARISTNLEISERPPDLAVVTLKIKNEDSSATTPLLVDVAVQFRHGNQWSAPISVIHPSGFVLKKQEEQILRATLKRKGEAIRASVTVKEQETGKVVGSGKRERVGQ